MATATFTTWAALYASMLNTMADFAGGGKFAIADYAIETGGNNSRKLTYRTFAEFERGLMFVKRMADIESGSAVRRTYAKQGGGGRW